MRQLVPCQEWTLFSMSYSSVNVIKMFFTADQNAKNSKIPEEEDCGILEVTKSNNVAGAEGRADPNSASSV